jgi:signal transduction histidine kinase
MTELDTAASKATDPDAEGAASIGPVRRKPDLETRIAAEQVRLLLDLGESSRYTIFGAIIVVGLAFYPTAPVWATGVVMAIQLVAQISFDRVRAGFRADNQASLRAMVWAQRYAACTFVSGLTWGIGGLLWLPGSSFAHQVFYTLVLACLAMATAITRASYPPAVAVYVATALTPTLIILLTSGDPLGFATVGLAALSLVTIAGWTRRVNRSYREAFRLRFENADLVERMARAHAATEQKRADAEEAERRAKAASGAKSEFLDILSHEVRTPLDTLARMAQQLRVEPLTDTQRNLAQAMSESSQMLRRLFDDMIDYSQMEAHTLELKPTSFDPADLAKSVVRLMRPQAKERGLSLELDLVPGTPPTMVADPDRLRQVLVNLVSNGIKFTETGGVVMRVQPVALDGQMPGLRFSVLDTGIGLTADARTRLFESFTQGEASGGEGRPGGMGLGLAVCDRLIALMGGQINVDSAAGQGSTFWFLLPREAGNPIISTAVPAEASRSTARAERLIDHDYLYELERELGAERTTDHMVETLTRILELYRKIEDAGSGHDTVSLRDSVELLQKAAGDIGLVAIADVAHDIGHAVDLGRGETALHDVPRLQQKITATWSALAKSFPNLSI